MFDKIAITAANAAQAEGYRVLTHGDARVAVVPDPGGRRIGSLGATVNVLRRCECGGSLLVCHSGGDARRTPAYAAMGKAFIPMRDGRPMFEHIVETMERLPIPPGGGVLVCSGDVLLDFDYKSVDFSYPGVTGIAYPDAPAQARRHGVYVPEGGVGTGARPVIRFLQKPDVRKGRWLVDTGILFVDWPTARKMRSLPIEGDIYDDFPEMLIGGFAQFHVNVVERCGFFHVGSSRELLELLGDGRNYVDAAGCELALSGGNIVTNIPPGRFDTVALRKNECLTCLPIGKSGWYDLRYRLDDNFKTDGLWERHGLGEKMKKVDYARLLSLREELSPKSRARIELPLRLDLAGGWSDTPPICNIEGGTVLNAAVTLEGRRPVVAEVKRIGGREVRVESVDLGKKGILKNKEEIYGEKDPSDWCALVKSALAVTGYTFDQGGLEIRISADVPKGSGMGTSSILGAALVQALLEVMGKPRGRDTVATATLRLEREMRTGGGWEDQLGALCPGVKLLETASGEEQKFTVRRLPAESERAFAGFLRSRGVLYFTGQKRMARNVLQGVLSFYAANPHGIARAIIAALKRDARSGFRAIARRDWRGFTAALNAYWMNKKALDAGSTNPQVESIIARIAPWTEAVTLTGAGGGGFLFAVAKSPSARKKMEAVLAAAGNGGRCYRFAIDTGETLQRENPKGKVLK